MATASVTNGNQNHAEIQQWDLEAANTLSSGNGNQHRDQLLNSIKEMAESSLEPPLSNKCCIYRIPTLLRKSNEEAYTPQVISIGPFHHGSKRLEPMQDPLKLKYFKRFLRRIEDFNVLEILVNDIKVHEERVRCCYAETINLSSDDFVKLILVDGGFLIEFFYSSSRGIHNVICENPTWWSALRFDLQLLENQLPFFVLNILFSHARLANDQFPSFTSLAIYFVEKTHNEKLPQNLVADKRHLLDLLRELLFPSRELPPQESDDLASAHDQLYTASQLYAAGVKFKVSSSKCLLDLKFTNGTLEIPCIYLDNATETIYRNIIAFEQCQNQRHDARLGDYTFLLKSLINTPKDAELLIRKGIIINYLVDSNAVASLFHNLDTNVLYYERESAYRGLFRDLNAFYDNTKHTWMVTLKRDYFGTPWKIASTIAAVTLLLLTAVQAICSIIQVVKM